MVFYYPELPQGKQEIIQVTLDGRWINIVFIGNEPGDVGLLPAGPDQVEDLSPHRIECVGITGGCIEYKSGIADGNAPFYFHKSDFKHNGGIHFPYT
jgi:hypothetical protein